jgi:hypothetical protein
MKVAGIGAAAAAIGLGYAIAENPIARYASATTSYPPGCTVAIAGAPGYLPRAGIRIENGRGDPVHARLEQRNGLPPVEFGMIGAGEIRLFAYTLPAGRNRLRAAGERDAVSRAVLTVPNHGAGTCKRRYVWRIE